MTYNVAEPNARETCSLASKQVNFYKTEGYLVLPSVFRQDEVDGLVDDVDRLTQDLGQLIDPHNLRVRFKPHCKTGQAVFEVFDPIADLSLPARRMTQDRRILNALQELYGEPAELFKDKLIYKPPGAIGATLHQDWIGWPGFPESFLTVLVALDPFSLESGATQVFPRVHDRGYLSPKDGQHHYLQAEQLESQAVPLLLEPGDVAIFSCFTPHYSDPNNSQQFRRGYFISYNAKSDGGAQYEKHYREYHAWLRGKAPSDKQPHLYFR